MMTHPPADAPRLLQAFLAVATGANDKAPREPGIGPTRHDVRQLRAFHEDCLALPTGALQMEKHVGYRVCMIAGTEPVELLSLYNEIRSHAGTWPAHEARLAERGDRMFFLQQHMLDDIGDVEDSLEDGSLKEHHQVEILRGVRDRAIEEAQAVADTAKAMREFSDHAREVLGVKIEEKIAISEGTEHDTTNHMQRAKLKRLLESIRVAERNYLRTMDADEGNLFGRRLARTVYGPDAVAAHDACFDALYAYKKGLGEVHMEFRVPKSLGLRRVWLGYAALAARSGSQALEHFAGVWACTAAALSEAVEAWEAAKDAKARKAVVESLAPLMKAWEGLSVLREVHDDVLG